MAVGEGRRRRNFQKRLQSAGRRENLAGKLIETLHKAEASGANQGNRAEGKESGQSGCTLPSLCRV